MTILRSVVLLNWPKLASCMHVGVRILPKASGGGVPPREIFSEFFWLFEPRGETPLSSPVFERTMRLRGTEQLSYIRFAEVAPQFNSYEEFIRYLEDV